MSWVLQHADFFNNRSMEWNSTYMVWKKFFADEGFTETELESATVAVFRRSKVPVFGAEHLNALKEELREIRRKAREAALKELQRRPPCPVCSNGGTVRVPNRSLIDAAGNWDDAKSQSLDWAVCDRCDSAKILGCGGLSLTDYESRVPNWRSLLARQDEIDKKTDSMPSSQVEREYEAIKARLRSVFLELQNNQLNPS